MNYDCFWPMSDWHIITDADDDEASRRCARDSIWNCFAIADLDDPFRRNTKIGVARALSGAQVATLLVLDTPDLQVCSPWGPAGGVGRSSRFVPTS